jgi:hypothetical protein
VKTPADFDVIKGDEKAKREYAGFEDHVTLHQILKDQPLCDKIREGSKGQRINNAEQRAERQALEVKR